MEALMPWAWDGGGGPGGLLPEEPWPICTALNEQEWVRQKVELPLRLLHSVPLNPVWDFL